MIFEDCRILPVNFVRPGRRWRPRQRWVVPHLLPTPAASSVVLRLIHGPADSAQSPILPSFRHPHLVVYPEGAGKGLPLPEALPEDLQEVVLQVADLAENQSLRRSRRHTADHFHSLDHLLVLGWSDLKY